MSDETPRDAAPRGGGGPKNGTQAREASGTAAFGELCREVRQLRDVAETAMSVLADPSGPDPARLAAYAAVCREKAGELAELAEKMKEDA